jgi:hypothetical protein
MRFLPTARARSITFNADESLTVAKAEQVENNVDALWNLIVLDFIDVATDVFAYTATADAWASAQSSQSSLWHSTDAAD